MKIVVLVTKSKDKKVINQAIFQI